MKHRTTSIARTHGWESVVSRNTGHGLLWRNIPIPQAHIAGLGLGIMLQFVEPWRFAVPWPLRLTVSAASIVGGIALGVWAVRSAGPVHLANPVWVVTTGAYRWSRNPMYVGWALLYVGVGLLTASTWLLVLLPLVLVITHIQVLAEEQFLTRQLGEPYVRYRARTHRYL
jgi:protein-S-isoprenylcysteine O-methyltransferase Ste14